MGLCSQTHPRREDGSVFPDPSTFGKMGLCSQTHPRSGRWVCVPRPIHVREDGSVTRQGGFYMATYPLRCGFPSLAVWDSFRRLSSPFPAQTWFSCLCCCALQAVKLIEYDTSLRGRPEEGVEAAEGELQPQRCCVQAQAQGLRSRSEADHQGAGPRVDQCEGALPASAGVCGHAGTTTWRSGM